MPQPARKPTLRSLAWTTASVAYAYALWLVSVAAPAAIHAGPTGGRELLHNALHVPAYGILTFLLIMTSRSFHPRAGATPQVAAAVWTAFAFGVAMEILQSHTPGRTASLIDATLNLMGCLLVAVLWKGLNKE